MPGHPFEVAQNFFTAHHAVMELTGGLNQSRSQKIDRGTKTEQRMADPKTHTRDNPQERTPSLPLNCAQQGATL